jgi:hypothetical protein
VCFYSGWVYKHTTIVKSKTEYVNDSVNADSLKKLVVSGNEAVGKGAYVLEIARREFVRRVFGCVEDSPYGGEAFEGGKRQTDRDEKGVFPSIKYLIKGFAHQ